MERYIERSGPIDDIPRVINHSEQCRCDHVTISVFRLVNDAESAALARVISYPSQFFSLVFFFFQFFLGLPLGGV